MSWTKTLVALLAFLFFFAQGAYAQALSAEKVIGNSTVGAGTPLTLSLRISNPFETDVTVRIVDKNVFGSNGLDIQCLEYVIPNRTTVEAAYPEIVPYEKGTYTLEPASLNYTNPVSGIEGSIFTNKLTVTVEASGASQGTVSGVTSIYRCGGISMQSTSYSYSSQQSRQDEGQQQNQQQDQQSMVQNNQMDQNANAIKQEIAKERAEQEKMEEEFQKTLEKNPEYQKQDQSLQQQGYKPTGSDNEPVSNDSGRFRKDYQNVNGENASLSGDMQNGSIKNMQAQTSEDVRQALSALRQDPNFREMEKQLAEQGYNATDPMLKQTGPNASKITVPYRNGSSEKNITADYVNGSIKNVKLEEEKDESKDMLWLAALFALIALCAYILYKKYSDKKTQVTGSSPTGPEYADYRSAARNMLAEAERLFSGGKEKDAYEKVSQAVRFYYSHDLDLNKDLSNTELLDHLKRKRSEVWQTAQKCLSLCGLVEFAKYNANRGDFSEILESAKKMIG